MHMHVHVHMHMHVHMQMHVQMHVHMRVHMHTHVHMHMHACTCICIHPSTGCAVLCLFIWTERQDGKTPLQQQIQQIVRRYMEMIDRIENANKVKNNRPYVRIYNYEISARWGAPNKYNFPKISNITKVTSKTRSESTTNIF